jgi:L-fuconolactonase
MTIVDTHVHVWDPARLPYPWLAQPRMADLAPLHRPMLPADMERADLERADLERADLEHADPAGAPAGHVFVEAACRSDRALDEIDWVASLHWPRLRGIVAAADLRSAALEAHLDALAHVRATGGAHVVGVRHSLQDEDSTSWRDDDAFVRGLHAVAARGWTFDACVRWTQLDDLAGLLAAAPEVRVVIDHLGKPPVDLGVDSRWGLAWTAAMTRLAARPLTFVKLSGLRAEASGVDSFARNADAFLIRGLDLFGSERAMVGSDWPVSTSPGDSVADWFARVRRTAEHAGASWDAVASRTASRFYRLAEVS